jgi:hypothetical protein
VTEERIAATNDQVGTWLVSWTHPKTKRFAWVAYQDVTLAAAEAQWRERHPDITDYSIYGKVRTVSR